MPVMPETVHKTEGVMLCLCSEREREEVVNARSK